MKFLTISSIALIASFAVSTNASAAVIDTFDFGATSSTDSLAATQGTSATNPVPDVTTILGGYHTVSSTRSAGTGIVTSRVNDNNTGFFSLDINDNFTAGSASVTIDGNGAGLGGVNLTNLLTNGSSDDQFAIALTGLVGVVDLSISLVDTFSGSATASTGFLVSTGIKTIAFSAFSGVDITSIDSITLTLTSLQNGTDADIEFFGTADSTPPSSVPVPGSVALLGLGLMGLRRKLRA